MISQQSSAEIERQTRKMISGTSMDLNQILSMAKLVISNMIHNLRNSIFKSHSYQTVTNVGIVKLNNQYQICTVAIRVTDKLFVLALSSNFKKKIRIGGMEIIIYLVT